MKPSKPFISLTDLVKTLELAGDADDTEAAEKFVADVEKVEFSDPDLVWVGSVKKDTTVWTLKEENDLEVEYSAELTADQIDEINETNVRTGDWALISLQAFASEETLTVTMQNGQEVYVSNAGICRS